MKGLAWRRLTLAEASRHDMKFRITCAGCGRTVMMSPLKLVTLPGFGFETRVSDIARRLRCSECGSRDVGIANDPDA
jgi:DNA-directed RNA polymerase subunit RPC12/RpoP